MVLIIARVPLAVVIFPKANAMSKVSAGFLIYRRPSSGLEVLLVHPGGPFWAEKNSGCWSIPKGELHDGEDHFEAAKREVEEELGFLPEGTFIPLGTVTQKSGKVVHAWGVEADWDAKQLKSNVLLLEWPPKSGKKIEIPEVDCAEYFPLETAKEKINPAQAEFFSRLEEFLRAQA